MIVGNHSVEVNEKEIYSLSFSRIPATATDMPGVKLNSGYVRCL
jgi:hypothetical protein